MKPEQVPPNLQELARNMMKKLQKEAAEEPDSLLASHIAMNEELDGLDLQVGEDFNQTNEARE